jgi:hypothetical protein
VVALIGMWAAQLLSVVSAELRCHLKLQLPLEITTFKLSSVTPLFGEVKEELMERLLTDPVFWGGLVVAFALGALIF